MIHGSGPYLTFDGGRTRAVDANGLLSITLSDGTQYTPLNNTSFTTPIVLPDEEQSFADIGMFVPTDTDSVSLSTLISPPNNYWGDDDGDIDVTATGSLSLSIVDNNNRSVSRNAVLTTCNNSAPYRVTLSSTDGLLSTRYGLPPNSTFNASSVTYFVNPKAVPEVCFAKPSLNLGDVIEGYDMDFRGPASIWNPSKGFLTQTSTPSFYGKNFPTTGANNLYFDLDIIGSNQSLFWSPVSQGGITATMSNSTATSVRVTLTGPFATESQHNSNNPGRIPTPTLPQTFELVGRDNSGNPVVKYGFTLKQWFVNRGSYTSYYPETLSWCNSIGYRMIKTKDLTNAVRLAKEETIISATPSSSGNYYQRRIGAGFFTEWGKMSNYPRSNFFSGFYWTSTPIDTDLFVVYADNGAIGWYAPYRRSGLCVYP